MLRRVMLLAPALALIACAGAPPAPPPSASPTQVSEASAPDAPALAPAPPPAASAAPTATASAEPTASAAPPTTSASPDAPPPPLPSGTTVLHIGDSFSGALGEALGKALEKVGIQQVLDFKDASYIPQWAGPTMNVAGLVAKTKPDLVIVTLGGNELEMPDPSVRADPIRRLVATFGDTPCVWVAPTIAPHTGLLDVVQKNLGHCRYFDSMKYVPDLPRTKDGIHPSIAGRRHWAEVFLDWLARERDPNGKRPWALKPAHADAVAAAH